jgi:hypothetical protein
MTLESNFVKKKKIRKAYLIGRKNPLGSFDISKSKGLPL